VGAERERQRAAFPAEARSEICRLDRRALPNVAALLEINSSKSHSRAVFIFEGRQTVTERALASEVVLMARTTEDALEIAVREQARLVYRIAYSVLRNHHDAEDATQEAFMRVLRYRRKLDGIRDIKTWLARIAWRVAIERNKRRPEISLSETENQSALMQLRSQLASAEESVIGNEVAELLGCLISVLPEPLRDALRLSTVEELEPGEIAEVLGTSESSVRSRLFRARQILEEKLAALEGKYESS
jgi:RNA polymerase sigma-70 factor, ECF subfamily